MTYGRKICAAVKKRGAGHGCAEADFQEADLWI